VVPLDRPEVLDLVFDRERVVEREPVFEFVPVLRERARDVEPVLRERDVREVVERPREPDVRDDVSPPPSSESPFEPSSFFPTPTAAAVARPTAAPVATFFGVDSPSFPSSDAIVNPPSVRR
jgi:hypothetical protein